MSVGSFILVAYHSSMLRRSFRLWVQPETKSLRIGNVFNNPTFTIPEILEFRAGGNRRGLGLHCRMVNFKFIGSSLPLGYKEGATLSLPWLRDNSTFRALVRGQTGTYQDFPVIVTGLLPEIVR